MFGLCGIFICVKRKERMFRMNVKTQLHVIYFSYIRKRKILKIFVFGLSIAFLFAFLLVTWYAAVSFDVTRMDMLNRGEGVGDKAPVIEDDLSGWIIYDTENTAEIFAELNEKDGALPVLATTIRPYAWMDQFEGIAVSNESERKFNIEKLLAEKSVISISKSEGPQVLILHTHGTESYNEGSLGKYYETDKLRSTDVSKNVVAIGSRMAEMLEDAGYSVIHDMTMHDDGNYNGSYTSSRKSINKYLEQYPSIKIVLDVHRDTVITEKAVKYRPVWENNGHSAAQVMILLGAGGSRFANSHWEENLKLSLLIHRRAEEIYPDLMRPILMRSSLYNQDLCEGGILVEVGTCGNTFSEAMLGGECFTECLIDVLDSLCKVG